MTCALTCRILFSLFLALSSLGLQSQQLMTNDETIEEYTSSTSLEHLINSASLSWHSESSFLPSATSGFMMRVNTQYFLYNRLSLEVMMGAKYFVRKNDIAIPLGVGLNLKIVDFLYRNTEKENSTLWRVSLSNSFVSQLKTLVEEKKLEDVFQLRHQLYVDYFFYKRLYAFFLGIGYETSNFTSYDYGGGSVVFSMGFRLHNSYRSNT